LGIQHSVSELLRMIEDYLVQGYRRVKIKIKPGWDVDVVRQIRRHFPDIPLMVDANSAYRLEDVNRLKALDEFNLLMIEQPLAHNDLVDHAQLQSQLSTPICLDESITSLEDVRQAVALGSCQIINVKMSRVGGLTAAKQIHEFCQSHQIPLWCGGMLESGIGRAHNIALATLSQFILPGDISASHRYWEKDIIEPEVTVRNGLIQVSDRAGLGYVVNREELAKHTCKIKIIRA
jgi:O-succinylbenzoate synthase